MIDGHCPPAGPSRPPRRHLARLTSRRHNESSIIARRPLSEARVRACSAPAVPTMAFFDIAATLLDDTYAVVCALEAVASILRQCPRPSSRRVLRSVTHVVCHGASAVPSRRTCPTRSHDGCVLSVCSMRVARQSVTGSVADAVFATYVDVYCSSWRPYADSAMELTARTGHKLGTITNGEARQPSENLNTPAWPTSSRSSPPPSIVAPANPTNESLIWPTRTPVLRRVTVSMSATAGRTTLWQALAQA